MRGLTYFEPWGFSINEGEFPNVHISWRHGRFFWYLALSPRYRFFWYSPRYRWHS